MPGSGLVRVRNYSVGQGLRHQLNYLVFSDEDELPERGLVSSSLKYDKLGNGLCRRSHQSKILTGNPTVGPELSTKSSYAIYTPSLIIRASFTPRDKRQWFQPRFNATGAEDGDFLRCPSELGATLAVARSAVVVENMPEFGVILRYMATRFPRRNSRRSANVPRHRRSSPHPEQCLAGASKGCLRIEPPSLADC